MIGLALKNYPKMTLWMSKSVHWIQRYHEVSWFVQSQSITTGLALKNYPKMTLWLSKSVHWIKRCSDIYFEVSWFVQTQLIVLQDWIGLKKLPQNDSLNVQIRPLDQKIQWYLYWSQLICTVTADLTSQMHWLQKTTPKWPFEHENPSTGSKDT